MDSLLKKLICLICFSMGYATLTPPNGFVLNELSKSEFSITVAGRKLIEHNEKQPLLLIGSGETSVVDQTIKDLPEKRHALTYFKIYREDNEILVTLHDNNNVQVTLTLLSDERNKLTIRFSDLPKGFDRIWLRIAAETSEHIYGGGQRLGRFDLRGHSVAIWSTGAPNAVRRGGATAPVDLTPYPLFTFVSSRLYYCVVNGHNYGAMDFSQPNYHELYVVGVPESVNINADTSFERLARKLTYFQGRPPTLPEWFGRGLLINTQGGETELQKQIDLATKHDITIGGVLISDWSNGLSGTSGTLSDWVVNSSKYPDFERLVKNLRQQRVDVYGLISPFLTKGSALFTEALQRNYLVRKHDNDTYLISGDHRVQKAIVDLTNEAAYDWFKELLKSTILTLGLRGWLADVGAGAPADGLYHSGRGGVVVHSEFPLLWAKVNRRACQEADPYAPQTPFPTVLPMETVFFTQAGTKDTTRYSPLSYTGVASADFNGLAATLRAELSLAVSGGGLTHFALGWGIDDPPTVGAEELVLRAAELAVFSPIMRIDDTLESLRLSDKGLNVLSTLINMHGILHEYTLYSSQRFTREGLSVIRPLFFHYNSDDECYRIDDQFLYGRDLLVAPVLQGGMMERRLYLPSDQWVYVYDRMHVITGPKWITIKSLVGRIPAFYRQESDWKHLFDKLGDEAIKSQ